MFHWSNPQQFGHWPPSPMPVSGSPHKFTSNQAPRVTFNYAPTQGNKYVDAIKLNEWNQPNNSIRYHTYEPGFQTSNPANTRHLDRNIIVQLNQQHCESPRQDKIIQPQHFAQPNPPQKRSIQQLQKNNEIDDSLSIYEPSQLIHKLRSSLDQNKLSSSGNDPLLIQFSSKNSQNCPIPNETLTNIVPASLTKTRGRDSGLKEIQESAIEILSSSEATSRQDQSAHHLIQSRYKIKMKRKELGNLQWAKLL